MMIPVARLLARFWVCFLSLATVCRAFSGLVRFNKVTNNPSILPKRRRNFEFNAVEDQDESVIQELESLLDDMIGKDGQDGLSEENIEELLMQNDNNDFEEEEEEENEEGFKEVEEADEEEDDFVNVIPSIEVAVEGYESAINGDGDTTDGEMLLNFVSAVDQTPIGLLSEDDLGLLRNVLLEFASFREDVDMDREERARLCEKTLFRMVDEWEAALEARHQKRVAVVEPRASDFSLVMNTWEDSGSREAPKRIGFIFQQLEELFDGGLNSVIPDLDMVCTVLQTLADSRDRGSEKRAWSLVRRLSRYNLEPNGKVYALLVYAMAKSRERGAAKRAEDTLRDALMKVAPSEDGITVETFNAVLTAWAKSDFKHAPERAEELMVFMDQVDQKHPGNGVLKPNVSSFTSVIDAYAQQTTWDGVKQSERILKNLLQEYLKSNDPDLEPNVASWTIVISAWTRLSKRNQRGAAPRADALLRDMENLFNNGHVSFPPDAITYVTVMNGWAFSRRDDGAKTAEGILDEMNEKYLDGDHTFKPSTKSVRNIVEAWMRSSEPDSIRRAESFLARYEELCIFEVPNEEARDIFKALLFGWSKRENPYRAQEYLVEMAKRGLKPDSFSFDRVIEAYTQLNPDDLAVRTKQVFDLMEKCRKAGDINPNERVYTSFLRSLTKAKVPKLAQKAVMLLNRMKELYKLGNKGIKPTVFSYNAVLHACAESRSDDVTANMDAFKIALTVFNELRSSREPPDHVTYGNMLRCSALLPDGEQSNAIITSTFEMCAKNGFVNSFVLRDLQYAADESLWRSLTGQKEGGEVLDVESLPASWSRRFKRKPETRKSSFN